MQTWVPNPFAKPGEPDRALGKIACRCAREAWEREQERRKRQDFAFRMKALTSEYGIQLRDTAQWTFDKDQFRSTQVSALCREYVNNWEEMRAANLGVLLYGPTGTGKTVYASCIVNALLEKQIPAALTTVPLLVGILQESRDRSGLLAHLNRYRLLVLDDFGAERDTSYAEELLFNVIDARKSSGLPLVLTTNLDPNDMRKETRSLNRKRIYDRVLELCPILLRLSGESLRSTSATERTGKAQKLLIR